MTLSETALLWIPVDRSIVRPLDTLETFVMLNDSDAAIGHEHWAISVGLRLAFPAPLSVANAALQLQRLADCGVPSPLSTYCDRDADELLPQRAGAHS